LPLVDPLQFQHTCVELVLLGRGLEPREELGPYLAAPDSHEQEGQAHMTHRMSRWSRMLRMDSKC
jgi:hypothetical protein